MSKIDNYFEEHFPGDGLFAAWRRACYRYISVDGTSMLTKRHFKSSTVIEAETLRHLLFNRNVIHYYSRFRYFWESLMMMTFGLSFFVNPLESAFIYGGRRLKMFPFLSAVISFIDVVSLMDVAIKFRSSYLDPETKEVVLEGRKIASRYVRGLLWADLLSSFPDRIVQSMLSEDKKRLIKLDLFDCFYDSDCRMLSFSSLWDALIIASFLKLLRMPLFFKYLDKFLQRRNWSRYFIKVIRYILAVIFFYHFMVCASFLIVRLFVASARSHVEHLYNSQNDESYWEATTIQKYSICLYFVTYTLSLFSPEFEEQEQVDMMLGIVCTLIGFCFKIWLIAQTYMCLRTIYGPSVRFQEIRFQMQKFLLFKRVSESTQERVMRFYDFLFNGNFHRKKEISALLGNELSYLVTTETCAKHLRNNYFFKNLPEEHLSAIASCMSEVFFLPNDVICKVDSVKSQKLYLIVSGAVAVYNEDGEEFTHLHDGSIFGETAFLLYDESFPSLNYVATEETILLVLTRSDFMKVLAESPDILSDMRKRLKENSQAAPEIRNIVEV